MLSEIFQHKLIHSIVLRLCIILLITTVSFLGILLAHFLPPYSHFFILIFKVIFSIGLLTTLITSFSLLECYYNVFLLTRFNVKIGIYIDIIKLCCYFIGIISFIAYFAHVNPIKIFTGISAFSAILLLLFRDQLLGFVASIQSVVSNIVQVGDRVRIEAYKVDGYVEKISFNYIQIRNLSDMLLTTLTTKMLSTVLIKNYNRNNGYRLCKCSILINPKSIITMPTDDYSTNISQYREHLTILLKKQEYVDSDSLFFIWYDINVNGAIDFSVTLMVGNDSYSNYCCLVRERCIALLQDFSLHLYVYE